MKKDGGLIRNWQLHRITVPKKGRSQFKSVFPTVDINNVLVVTGTVVNEPTGRWNPGDHFRSTYIVKLDRKNKTIETCNTIYHFDPNTEKQDSMPDLGNNVLNIFY